MASTESPRNKRVLKSDEKPKPNSKKQIDEISQESKKLGQTKSPQLDDMLEPGWIDDKHCGEATPVQTGILHSLS